MINLHGLKRASLSHEDLFEALRGERVRQLGQVQRAYFEQNGRLTVFIHPEDEPSPLGLPIVPPWDIEAPPAAFAGAGPLACLHCGRVQGEAMQTGTVQTEAQKKTAGRCACGEDQWTLATADPLALAGAAQRS